MHPYSSLVFFLAVVAMLCAPNATAETVCTSNSDVSMSQGFITAALSSINPLGVGYCTNNLCDKSLAACPNSTCCLPNYGGNSGSSPCGCLKEHVSGRTTCVDPNLLHVEVSACDQNSGAEHEISVQLFIPNDIKECVSQTTSELVTTVDGKLAIKISTVICIPKGFRNAKTDLGFNGGSIRLNVNYTVYLVDGDLRIGEKLYHILGREQVQRLLAYHKSLQKSNL